MDDVLIAGAGIGGLTAALALHTEGITARVVESAREIRPLGVGINLLPQAVRELTELGLGDELARIGVATAEIRYCDQRGHTLFAEPRGLAGGYRWPQYSVHRGRLQLMLLDAVRARLGADAVVLDAPLRDFTQDADAVHVRAGGTHIETAALVGADGLHSVVRAAVHPGPDPLLWSGTTMWRGLTETDRFLDGRTMIIARDDGHAELLAYPVGERLVNWVALVVTGEAGPLPGDANWNRPGRAEDVLAYFHGWDLGWLDPTRLIEHSTVILEYPMVDREPLPRWGTGRVTLLGDAAHPMYPVGANGASQAILDGRALATALRAAPDPITGLRDYEQDRRAATTAVVLANRAMQRTGHEQSTTALASITATYRRATNADR